jgi:hypothetical protein
MYATSMAWRLSLRVRWANHSLALWRAIPADEVACLAIEIAEILA